MPTSMFQQGFFKGGFAPMHLDLGSASLGQASSVSEADRNAMLARLAAAGDKFALVNAWTQAHLKPTDVQATFGADAARWTQLLSNIDVGGWGAPSATLTQALTSPDPAVWAQPSAGDWNASESWIAAVNELAAILQRHPAAPAAIPGARAVTPAPSSNMTPILIGVAAVTIVGIAIAALR